MHPSEPLSPRDAFGARVVAYVLDLLVIGVSVGPLAGGAGWAFAFAFSFVYLGIAQGVTGYTLAKAVLGARVVRAGTVEPPGVARSVLRWLVAPVGIPVITTIVAITNDRRRGAGDLLAGTEVVGMAPSGAVRAGCVLGLVGLVSIFVALSTFDTFVALAAIFAPMAIGGLVIVLGLRRMKGAILWLAGLAFSLVAASMMSFVSFCHHGGGHCTDVAAGHKAIPALVACVVAIVAVFAVKGGAARVILMVATAFAEVWMVLRLKSGADMGFAAFFLALLLIAQIATEVAALLRERREPAVASPA